MASAKQDSSMASTASTLDVSVDADDLTSQIPDEKSSERDPEALRPAPTDMNEQLTDPNLVTWDDQSDVTNPQNWSLKQKWLVTSVVSLFTFISPVTSAMVAPALSAVRKDLNIHSDIEEEMALSIFILGYAVGPLFFGPISELIGRARILQISNMFFVAFNLGCGLAQNSPEMFVFRFLAGVGGSAPLAVGGGVLTDVWPTEQRGRAIAIYSLGPVFGPAMGPIAGGFVAEYTTWRWVFWSTTIAAAGVQAISFLWLRETHGPTILRRKKERLVRETGNADLHTGDEVKSFSSALGTALTRPSRMLATQPVVQAVALYMAFLYGITYLITVSFTTVWTDVYHERLDIGGFNYISLGLGTFLGVQINMYFVDRIYVRLKERNGGVGQPEFRLPALCLGSILVPIGLLWFGWSVQGHTHWIMPNLGIAIFSGGVIFCLQSMQGYIIDSYSRYAASAIAAAVVLRSICGFAFPLFAPYLYDAVGYGWGSTILAFVSIALGTAAPIIFWVYGPKLREKSNYAGGG